MRELKRMIIECLSKEYPMGGAIDQVESAEIVIKGDTVAVKYDNGEFDTFKVVIKESLVLTT